MDLLERSERQGCPQHLDATMVYRDSAWRCCVCNSHVVMVDYVTLPAATYKGAVEAERKRVADYLRSRAADNWDPSVEAALRQVAHEVDRDHHHGGR